MIGFALSFFATRTGKYVALSLAVLAILAGLYGLARHQGATSVRHQVAMRDQAARADLAAHEAKAAQISAAARNTLSQRQAQVITRTRTIVQKVVEYVPAAADARCDVPTGFVQLHDAAARGLPGPSGGPDPAPSGVPLSAVAETVAENYGVAYGWREEVMAWRDWYVQQRAAWEKH